MQGMKKIISTVLLVVEIVMTILAVAIFVFDFPFGVSRQKDQTEPFIETYTDKSQFFYDIQEIYYFDKHIFCLNNSQNSITILDENGNYEKEIKFADTDGHVAVGMFLLNDELYVLNYRTNILLKYSKWDLYEEDSLKDDDVLKYQDLYCEEEVKTAYIDKNNYYKVNEPGTELFKVEGDKETLIKQSSKSELFNSLNIEFIFCCICIFTMVVINLVRRLALKSF